MWRGGLGELKDKAVGIGRVQLWVGREGDVVWWFVSWGHAGTSGVVGDGWVWLWGGENGCGVAVLVKWGTGG